MPVFTDQLMRQVKVVEKPMRIVSLVPSQTELLAHLGLSEEVVGITKFCIHPQQWFKTKQRIGGTKNPDIQKITSLQPDLILANKEENNKEDIEALQDKFPVWVSDVNNLEDAVAMIKSVGEMIGTSEAAGALIKDIKSDFATLPNNIELTQQRVAYLIWKDPYITIGGDTFIHHMLEQAGFQNCFATSQRYPVMDIERLAGDDVDCIFLSSEPYPFQEKHVATLQAQFPMCKVLLVDGELFSWYGSRLLHSPSYFKQLQQQIKVMQ